MINIKLPEKGDILTLKNSNGTNPAEQLTTRTTLIKVLTNKGFYDLEEFDLPDVAAVAATASTTVAPEQKNKKKHSLNAVLMLIIFILLALLSVAGVYIIDNSKNVNGLIAIIDTPIDVSGIPDGYDELTIPITDPTIDKLNEKLEMNKMCINMNSTIDFLSCDSTGYFGIKNDVRNNYPQFVTITLDSNGAQIYQTGLIDVGDCILYDMLDVKLPKGMHACTATFTQVNTETNTACGQASAKVTITVNS